jgi:type IV pilus assembly protein PilA
MSVRTDADGIITVRTSGALDLKEAADKTIQLVPLDSTGAPLDAATDIPTQVASFKCGPGTVDPIDSKYLPGSCK